MVSGSRYSSWSFRIIQLFFENAVFKLSFKMCCYQFHALAPKVEKEDFCISNLECKGGLTLCHTSVYLIFLQRGFLN